MFPEDIILIDCLFGCGSDKMLILLALRVISKFILNNKNYVFVCFCDQLILNLRVKDLMLGIHVPAASKLLKWLVQVTADSFLANS